MSDETTDKIKMKKVHKGEKRKIRATDLADRFWVIMTVLSSVIYLTWRILKTIPFEYGIVSLVAGIVLLLVEILGFIEALIHYSNMFTYESFPVPVIPEDEFPHVDILIATYNESVDLLYKTVNGCKHMDYPDKSKVHIYICDDGRREDMRRMAQEAGVGYIIREDNAHAKAGNLNNALKHTASPYIVTFDADMIPQHNFLLHTVPFFIDREIKNRELEEKDRIHIGFVQTPQSFYNPDLFQYDLYSEGRIPNEQDFFYRDIEVSRNHSNSVIYGGSNTVISRLALETVGGFFDQTITEDYGTGILIEKAGFQCLSTAEVLASGMSPTDLQSLIQQRIRWARGVISTNRKQHIFISPGLSLAQKANYWASEFYWYSAFKRLVYYASPILYAVFNYVVVKCTLKEVLIFWLPMFVFSNISLRRFSGGVRTTKWTSIYETALFPFMLFPVLLEGIGVTMKTFKVTRKDMAGQESGENTIYLIPFAILIILSVIGIVRLVLLMMQSNSSGPIVVLFWIVYNLYTLIMASFFIMGRRVHRKTERVIAEEDCELTVMGTVYECRTKDLSETGLAITLDIPVFISEDEDVDALIKTERYRARLKLRVVHVDNLGERWKYSFKVTDYCGDYDEYLQILYDRIPTLPQKLSETESAFTDLNINTSHRLHREFFQNRRLPRVEMSAQLADDKGEQYSLGDFNYEYLTIVPEGEPPEKLILKVDAEGAIVLNCSYKHKLSPEGQLYGIDNYRDIYRDTALRKQLEDWVTGNCKGKDIG